MPWKECLMLREYIWTMEHLTLCVFVHMLFLKRNFWIQFWRRSWCKIDLGSWEVDMFCQFLGPGISKRPMKVIVFFKDEEEQGDKHKGFGNQLRKTQEVGRRGEFGNWVLSVDERKIMSEETETALMRTNLIPLVCLVIPTSESPSAFSNNINVLSGSSFKTPWSTQVDKALIAAPRSIEPTDDMRSSKVQTARG